MTSMMDPVKEWDLPRRTALLSASLVSADLMHLEVELSRLVTAGVNLIHFDVMDGHFCPGLTIGPTFVAQVRTPLKKDVHLMVEEPIRLLDDFVAAGADMITMHLESGRHVHRALELLSEARNPNGNSILRGLAVNPGSETAAIEPFLDVSDVIYVLGVNPGWRQPLLPSTVQRVRDVQELVERRQPRPLVAVDGGITGNNFATIASLEPDIIVSGSAVLSGDTADANLRSFLDIHEKLLARQGKGPTNGH